MVQDKRFQRFKDELAYWVMHSINERKLPVGKKPTGTCRCPLGAHPNLGPFPGSWTAAAEFNISQGQALAFIRGYEGSSYVDTYPPAYKYRELGLAYRRKFIEGV